MQEDEIRTLEEEGERKFSPQYWLPDAAKRASQMSISSHPCTFSHPSARKNKNGYVTSVIAKKNRQSDGYLRTGNLAVPEDALGNAAALDVYKFLILSLEDGRSLQEHISHDSDQAKNLLTTPSENYEKLKKDLLSMVDKEISEIITSSKIKQVYFSVGDGKYHLLSILSNSGLIYELRKRIDQLRFSEKQKALRNLKRNNQFSKESFSEIYKITTIGYGGTKPQNISVLNSQHGGKARLLMSAPPCLEKRNVQFPNKNFFINSIRFYDIREPLQKLHNIFKTELNTSIPRRNLESGRDHYIEEILDQIIVCMNSIRLDAATQYLQETSKLPRYQKIWLCNEYQQERLEQQEWLDELCEEIVKWILASYKKTIKKSIVLGSEEREYIKGMITTRREILR